LEYKNLCWVSINVGGNGPKGWAEERAWARGE